MNEREEDDHPGDSIGSLPVDEFDELEEEERDSLPVSGSVLVTVDEKERRRKER